MLLQVEFLSHVKIGNGLFNASDGRILVIFINQNRHPVTSEKGKLIGIIERVNVVNVVAKSHVDSKLADLNAKLAKDMVKVWKLIKLNS